MFRRTSRNGVILCTVLLIAAVILSLGGCKKKGPDLKGMNIVVGNWWSNYDVNTFTPQNANEEKTLAWRKKIQEDYGFTMVEKNIAGWGEMSQLAATSIIAGDPAATVFVLQDDWAMSLVRQNLAYPVSDNTAVDLKNPKPVPGASIAPEWNQAVNNNFTFNGKIYAFANGINLSNTDAVFWNKRLFREAGLDPELPYNMQKDGTWTWDNFINICKQLTRDINNDGVIDTWATTRDFSSAILSAFIASNGAMFVDKDPSGKLVNAIGRPEFLEALQFIIRLEREGIMKPAPAGARWDWFKSEFPDGNVAMRIEDSYVWGEHQNMRDDWGIVLPPRGPRSATVRVFTRENVLVVPATFTAEEVDKIMFALALWYTPLTDDWKGGLYNTFRDARAVDETVALIRDTKLHINKNQLYVPGLNIGNIAWSMWGDAGNNPAQLIESVSPNWNNLIAEANALMK